MRRVQSLTIAGHDQGVAWFFWEWDGDNPSGPNAYAVDPGKLGVLLAMLAEATPAPGSGETTAVCLERVFGRGALSSREREAALAYAISDALLPAQLRGEILERYASSGGAPIRMRLMPSASTARVPWTIASLASKPEDVDTAKRLVELADIAHEVPAGLHAGRTRVPATFDKSRPGGSPLYVIDPSNVSDMGSVLDRSGLACVREAFGPEGHAESTYGGHFDRRTLQRGLNSIPAPARLFFMGHVLSSDDSPGSASMLLSDTHEMYGTGPLFGETRPLSALDLLEGTSNDVERVDQIEERDKISRQAIVWPTMRGHRQIGADIWPMPPRVVLLACSSGSDLGNTEPFGLAMAMINAGAEFVTATKWPLPTDTSFSDFASDTSQPLARAAVSIDLAHRADDPVAAVCSWQREQVRLWRDGSTALGVPPLIFATLDTFMGAQKAVTQLQGVVG